MTGDQLLRRVRVLVEEKLPLPGAGETARRHRRLMEIGQEDLSLARLAEAHWDAVAILAEAGQTAEAGVLYGVWAAEKPGQALQLAVQPDGGFLLSGEKAWLSGAGLVDRALITAGESVLVNVDLRAQADRIAFDGSGWKTEAFHETQTAVGQFDAVAVAAKDLVGGPGWYTGRPGFWHGACGPAACWAGGAAGLVQLAMRTTRQDAHTFAHLGAIEADVWALKAYLDAAGREIDQESEGGVKARVRALTLRHLVEQACTDVLRRLPRALGPGPLAMDQVFQRRYAELDLYLRQSHAERDLEMLGRGVREATLSVAS